MAQLARHMPKISIEVGLGRVEFFLDPKNVNKQRQEESKIPSLRHPVDGFQGGFYLKVLLFSGFKPQSKMTWIPRVLPSKTAFGVYN